MKRLWILPALAVLAAPVVLQEMTRESDGGWVPLFDGVSLEGWTDRGGPHVGDAKWTVEDGVIVGRQGPTGGGGMLYTKKFYRNFEVELEARIDYPFDSGVFVRMAEGQKGAQVTLDHRPNGEIGGIYSGGWYWHAPHGKQHFHEDWNRVRVRCLGTPMTITAWINDKQVCNYTMPGARDDYAEMGMIGLQVHPVDKRGEEATRFRAVRIRELSDAAGEHFESDELGNLSLTTAGRDIGWRPLDWEDPGPTSGFRVQGGEIELLVDGDAPHVVSKDDFRDFHLRLDFKLSKMANSGLFLRCKRDDSNPAYSGCEIQILDDFNWEKVTDSVLKPYQFTGGLYGAVAPKHDAMRPLGQWNTYEIHYVGRRLQTVLNARSCTTWIPTTWTPSRRSPSAPRRLYRATAPRAEASRGRSLRLVPQRLRATRHDWIDGVI